MADAEQEKLDQEEGSPAVKKTGLLTWGIVAVIAMTAGAAVPFVANSLMSGAEADADEEEVVDDEPAFVPFGEVVVNLNEGRLNRYLRLKLTLQVSHDNVDEITASIAAKKVLLTDWLISYLSDKSMDEIRGAIGQNRLRREIRDQFNTVLFPDGYDRIHDVLFEEFNVQ